MEKKNTGLVILVIVLSLLVVGLGGFIIYDKVLSGGKIENNNIDVDSKDNEVNDNDENINDEDFSKQYKDIITDGIWYMNGTVFSFKNEKTLFSIGKYASDAGYGGNIKLFEENFSQPKKYIYKIEAVADACTEQLNCINISNGYKLQVELEYDITSPKEITIIKLSKTEDNVTENFDTLKGVYSFAGNNWDEVYDYVEKLRNNN